jgi:hypothetical protein
MYFGLARGGERPPVERRSWSVMLIASNKSLVEGRERPQSQLRSDLIMVIESKSSAQGTPSNGAVERVQS